MGKRHKTRRRAKLAALVMRHPKGFPAPGLGLPPASLLGEIAVALNAAEIEGATVQLAHGAVITDYGYVLRLDDVPGQRWQARTRLLAEFAVPPGDG